MNILHINTLDKIGGAAKAMYRLHQGFNRMGHDSSLLVGQRTAGEEGIYHLYEQLKSVKSFRDRVIDYIGYRADKWWGWGGWRDYSTRLIPKLKVFQKADVVNLHNLHGEYFNIRALSELCRHKPVVWTLHDMWAFTGHCAYAYECERWKTGCENCPLLKGENKHLVEPSPPSRDRTNHNWRTKREIYKEAHFFVITPSRWLYNLAKESILASTSVIHHIPNGVDTDVFHPMDPKLAREALDLPFDKKIIFFSAHAATQERKGFPYLQEALKKLVEDVSEIALLVSGNGQPDLKLHSNKFKVRFLGPLHDEAFQRLAFAASDLFVFPTLADNHPLVLLESLACGTPAVSFDVGGVPEIVRHMETGYLARYKDADDLANGIKLLLENSDLRNKMKTLCRKTAEKEFSLDLQCQRYLKVYEEAKKKFNGV